MSLRISILLFLVLNLSLQAQRPIGEWDSYMPYRIANSLSGHEGELYIAAGNSFYYQYGIDGGFVELATNTERLSTTDPKLCRYNPNIETLVLTYANSVIDLVRGDKVTKLDGIANNNFYVNKSINEIHFIDERAFLACGFGITIVDLESGLFLDDFPVGQDGATIQVFDIVDNGELLIAATEEGLISIDRNNSFPDNFANWTRYGEDDPTVNKAFQEVCFFNDKVYATSGTEMYVLEDAEWTLIYDTGDWDIRQISSGQTRLIMSEYQLSSGDIVDTRVTLFENENAYSSINELFIGRPYDAYEDANGAVWVADNWFGVSKIVNGSIEQRVLPNGPHDHKAKNIAVSNGKVYVAPGDLDWALNPGENSANRDGFYVLDGTWKSFTQLSHPVLSGADDIAFLKTHPNDGSVYFGSFKNGLVRFKDGEPAVLTEGSTLTNSNSDQGRIRVTGMDFDADGNLWMANHIAEKPLAVYAADGSWKSFGPFGSKNRLFNVLVDRRGQKWCLVSRDGIVVFDEGAEIFDDEEDQFRLLSNIEGAGSLQSERVFCIAEDHDGEIWVGTNDGIAVFFCASQVFREGGCNASRPTLIVDGENRYLMQEQIVRAIAIDGGNRKWIGTDNGLRLFSADGKQDLAFFTEENSPLLSDQILSLAYDESSGALYIGTEKGINSFQTEAIGGSSVHGDVLVYPNPVRPEYDGPIAIRGLVQNAEVKITDIAGNLIFETEALGSQAVWDGKNYNGRRAATGVYLVFSSNADGTETFVTKLFFVN